MRGCGGPRKTEASEPPHPRSLRSLDLSPPGRGEIETRSRDAHVRPSFASRNVKQPVARIERSESRVRLASSNGRSRCSLPPSRSALRRTGRSPRATRYEERRKRNAGRRSSPSPACKRRAGRATDKAACAALPLSGALACRRSTTALAKGITSSLRLGFRPGFLGRGLNGRYPPSPVPVQRSTSHPGRNAGGLMPKPPGSGVQIRPRAPHSPRPTGVPPGGRPLRAR